MFPVEIVGKDEANSRVKLHYVGYGANFDEWKEENELKILNEEHQGPSETPLSVTNAIVYSKMLGLK